MADLYAKDDIVGFNRSQLKYMLLHKATIAQLIDYDPVEAQLFYDTTYNALGFNDGDWVLGLNTLHPDNAGYSSDTDIAGRLLIGTGLSNVIGYNPTNAGFLVLDADGIPTTQEKILFADIDTSAYDTVISAPGEDTKFATEKAIVDYVTASVITPTDNILDWDGTSKSYKAYAAKKGSDPGYPYFFTGTSETTYSNRLNIDATLYATNYRTRDVSGAYYSETYIQSAVTRHTYQLNSTNYNQVYFNIDQSQFNISSVGKVSNVTKYLPISIGDSISGTQYIAVDKSNTRFTIDTTKIKINRGTINKYLYLDANNEISYVDNPSPIVSLVDGLWSLDYTAGAFSISPFTAQAVNVFYTEAAAPNSAASLLNYNGIFRATQLYEGSVRVMTTHGVQAADGNFHAVTQVGSAGFCPALPPVAPDINKQFLRADGTWASVETISPWSRDDINLFVYTTTAGDSVVINSTTALSILTIGEVERDNKITFGVNDLGDNVVYDSVIRWFANGAEQTDIAYIGLKDNGASSYVHHWSSQNTVFTTPLMSLNTDALYCTAFTSTFNNAFDGDIVVNTLNLAAVGAVNARSGYGAGVHPSTGDYATVSLLMTGKAYAGEADWVDDGAGYLAHSANLLTGGTTKPALNIGTRDGKPIRFFAGAAGNTNFNIDALRMLINSNGTVQIGDFKGGNYSQFDADGTLRFFGNATVYTDIDFPIIIRTTGANIPVLAGIRGGLTAPQWAVNDYNSCEGQELVHGYKEGSDMVWHIHLITGGTDATDRYVKFQIDYIWANVDATESALITVTSPELLIPGGTPAAHHLMFNIATISHPTAKFKAHFKPLLKRVAALGTAPTANPFVEMLQLHCILDSIGSNTVTTK